MKSRIVAHVVLTLLILELLLVFVSWLLSATMTAGVRPLLSNEGVRWLLGRYVNIVLSPVLVWILLLGIAYGALVKSRLLPSLLHPASSRERLALRVSFIVLVLFVGVVVWMVAMPQALLLSATGSLWPSPFSRALVPLLSFGVSLVAVCYGSLSHTFTSLSSVSDALVWGIAKTAPLLLVYVFAVQLYESLHFVFL